MNDMATAGRSSCSRSSEAGRNLLAVPLLVGPGVQAVIELFDQAAGTFARKNCSSFGRRRRSARSCFGRRWAIVRRSRCSWALGRSGPPRGATDRIDQSLQDSDKSRIEEPPPEEVRESAARRVVGSQRRRIRPPRSACAWPRPFACSGCATGQPHWKHCIRTGRELTRPARSCSGVVAIAQANPSPPAPPLPEYRGRGERKDGDVTIMRVN